ncbi:hypothetical protein BDF22DRAFT_741891 [Syncephalis plumigaleata]|nr:hypothetical protein BDF22DRAFT_741891 [Syncephalis plumigaleata]
MSDSWVQIDPTGEITSLTYLLEAKDGDINELRERFIGQWRQMVINALLLCLFAMNTRKAIEYTLKARRPLIPLLCLVQATTGVILGVFSLLTTLVYTSITCRMVIWLCVTGMVISSLCVNAILLNKVYKVYNCSRSILIMGICLSLCQFSFVYVVVHQTVTRQTPADGCFIDYPFYYPWQRLLLDLPINMFSPFQSTTYPIQNANLVNIETHQSTVYQYQEEWSLPQETQTCVDLYQQSYDPASYQEHRATPNNEKNHISNNSVNATNDTRSSSNSHPYHVASWDHDNTRQHASYRSMRLLDFFVRIIPKQQR